MLGSADPVRVDRLHVLRVGLAAPLEQEPGRGVGARGDELGVDRGRLPVGDAGGLGNDRDHRRREAGQIVARLVVRDVDQLLELPFAREVGGDCLKVGGRISGQIERLIAGRGLEAGLRSIVDEQPPDLLERDDADEVLDVDAAVAQSATVAIGLGDLGLEGNDPLEAWFELAHHSPRSSPTGRHGTLPDRSASPVAYARGEAAARQHGGRCQKIQPAVGSALVRRHAHRKRWPGEVWCGRKGQS